MVAANRSMAPAFSVVATANVGRTELGGDGEGLRASVSRGQVVAKGKAR